MRKLSPEETAQLKAELKLPPEQRGLPENWGKSPAYKAWIQLDFANKDKNNNYEVKQYHENYWYDLKAAIRDSFTAFVELRRLKNDGGLSYAGFGGRGPLIRNIKMYVVAGRVNSKTGFTKPLMPSLKCCNEKPMRKEKSLQIMTTK